ncbi:MAG TPA: MFS transporter [Chloroflexia bacterium]|nr:MFS transporter [Chloroflexia bacterium]
MLAALRQRNFALLWVGTLISLIGDRALMTALPFFVYQQTGSTLAMAGMFGAFYLPGFLFGSVAGVFVDRWNRKRILVVTNVIQSGVMLLLLAVQSSAWLWLVFVVTFTQMTLAMFTIPAEGALLPNLVDEDHLVQANALTGLGNTIARLVGPLLGGVVIGFFGLTSVVLIDSVSFMVAAVLIGRIVVAAQPAAPPPDVAETLVSSWRKVGQELVEGLRLIRRTRLIAALFIVNTVTSMGGTLIDPLFVPFAQGQLQAGAEGQGFLSTIGAVGGLLGGVIIGWIGTRIQQRLLIGFGTLIVGLFMLVIYNQTSLPVAAVLICLMMVPVIASNVASSTALQTGTPDAYRGRIYGAMGTSNALIGLVSVGLAGALGEVVGVVPMLSIAAGITMFAGVLGLVLLPKSDPRGSMAPEREEHLIAT